MKEKPNFNTLFNDPEKLKSLFLKEANSQEFSEVIKKGINQYLTWDKFRYQKMPNEVSPEEAWLFLMLKRTGTREKTPVQSYRAGSFGFVLTKEHMKMLRQIDSEMSGSLTSDVSLPDGKQKEKLLINGLIEEAINSSQLEGASTSRHVAKDMIRSGRKPKDESERMILNNFLAMEKIEQWTSRDLDEQFLLEIHYILTKDILNEQETGKFRKDEDNIVVQDSMTGEVVHTAPPVVFLNEHLKNLYKFANTNEDSDYYHPFIKAVILHFWIGYLHPFVDGNGRTARVIFYWYLIKNNYWLFKYVTTSKTIKMSKIAYANAYIHAEQPDELDLGYFIQYILRTTLISLEDFKKYIKRKKKEEEVLRNNLSNNELNERQISLINHLTKSGGSIDIEYYRRTNNLVYESARRDLITLEEKELLIKRKVGRKFVYELGKKHY